MATSRQLQPPSYLEDYNDDNSTAVPGTRRIASANVRAKRRPNIPKPRIPRRDEASNSGYSVERFTLNKDERRRLKERRNDGLRLDLNWHIPLASKKNAEVRPGIFPRRLVPTTILQHSRVPQKEANLPIVQYSAQDVESVIEELVTLFANDAVLKPLYQTAVESKSISGDRLENNLRRFLRSYSYDLRETAEDALEIRAARLVRSHAKCVASAIRRKFEPRHENVSTILSAREESSVSSEEDVFDKSDGEDIPSLTSVKLFMASVKLFMLSGDAFNNLCQNLQNFVFPEKAQQPLQLPIQWGIGDLLAVTKLAWDLYHNCFLIARDDPDNFRQLVNELGTLQGVLRNLQDDMNLDSLFFKRLDENRREMLKCYLSSCCNTLQKLQELIIQNPKRRLNEAQYWQKFKWTDKQKEISYLKSKIIVHTIQISLYMTTMDNSSLARFETDLARALERQERQDEMCEETDKTTSLTRAKITPNNSSDAEQCLYQIELETEKSSVPSSTLLSSTWGESKLRSEQLATPSQPSFDDDSSYESSSYQTPPVVQPSMTSSPAPALVNPKSGFSLPSVEALVEHTPLLQNANDVRSAVSEKQRQELLAQEDGAIPNHTDTLNMKEQHLIRSSVKNMFSDTIDTNSSSSQSSWTTIKSLNTGGMKQGKNDLHDVLESAKDQPLIGATESPDDAEDAVDRVKDTAEDTAGNFLIELSALKGLEIGVRGQTLGRCKEPIGQLEEGDPEDLIGQNFGDNGGILHEDGDGVDRATILLDKAQEFADGVSLKRYWFNDQGKIFYLTPGASVPNPGYVDAVKQFIESSVLGHHVNWWPLKPLDTGCPEDYMRISWSCGCGAELYIDVASKDAEEYAKHCSADILASGNSSVLPMYNNLSTAASSFSSPCQSNSANSSKITQKPPSQHQPTSNSPIPKDTRQHKIFQDTLSDRYVHWCVDANKLETKLNHIPIFSLKDVKFIHDLKAAYNSVMGARRWFSLTSCYGVKFIIFERIHRTKELVACGPEDLPCPNTNQDYTYQYVDPRALFTKTLEKSLMHHFHNPRGCGAEDIEDILSRIPKKIKGKLVNKYGIQGYGMQAVSGWALWKFILAVFISQIGPLVFAAKWLWGGHPGDLQNAFMVSMWVFAAMGSVVVVPDVWKLRE